MIYVETTDTIELCRTRIETIIRKERSDVHLFDFKYLLVARDSYVTIVVLFVTYYT